MCNKENESMTVYEVYELHHDKDGDWEDLYGVYSTRKMADKIISYFSSKGLEAFIVSEKLDSHMPNDIETSRKYLKVSCIDQEDVKSEIMFRYGSDVQQDIYYEIKDTEVNVYVAFDSEPKEEVVYTIAKELLRIMYKHAYNEEISENLIALIDEARTEQPSE
jgi:hypothetical protein